MKKEIDFIADLNEKYAVLEYELDEKLKAIIQAEKQLEATVEESDIKNEKTKSKHYTLDAARRRNFELLKSLEVSKARLRSRATFSPLETILQKAVGNYLKETSLVPCTTKKTYGPTYV